ncbi:MAG: TIGR02391 family protein, partial [Candidatus Paceibacterota bacterium]
IENLDDFKKYDHIKLLPRNVLDERLAQKVWSTFIRGDFEIAILSAFKEVEVRIRSAAKLKVTDLGVNLARLAFNPEHGPLTDTTNPDGGERVSYMELFSGSIGAFKNPSSHRDVNYDDPVIATSLILYANTLLKIIDQRSKNK